MVEADPSSSVSLTGILQLVPPCAEQLRAHPCFGPLAARDAAVLG